MSAPGTALRTDADGNPQVDSLGERPSRFLFGVFIWIYLLFGYLGSDPRNAIKNDIISPKDCQSIGLKIAFQGRKPLVNRRARTASSSPPQGLI
jgi:hypothetical protein